MPGFLRLKLAFVAFLLGGIFATAVSQSKASDLQIAATIAPIHSLVSMVTEGLASPELIVRPGASPHGYALKPSEARSLDTADVVFWVGEALEPWMAKSVMTLAGDAVVVELGEIEGVERLAFRKGGIWEEHGHDDEAKGDEAHHNHGHDHAADSLDPHLWLSPNNALIWLDVIAETLVEHDPEHADDYRRNADGAAAGIKAIVAEIEGLLQPYKETSYLVFHDAYQYFERHFDLHPLGAIRLSDADRPGPARIIEVKETLAKSGAVCVFTEPQFEPRLIDTVIEGTEVKRGILDPIGAALEPGAELYPSLMRGLAENLVACLG